MHCHWTWCFIHFCVCALLMIRQVYLPIDIVHFGLRKFIDFIAKQCKMVSHIVFVGLYFFFFCHFRWKIIFNLWKFMHAQVLNYRSNFTEIEPKSIFKNLHEIRTLQSKMWINSSFPLGKSHSITLFKLNLFPLK